jgi:predicted MPP superfamily phosphohydrolase
MTLSSSPSLSPIGRRRFLQAGLFGAAGAVLYPGEIERHWIDVTHHDFILPGLAPGMNGMRIVQLSDIHLDEFTEPYFLRQVIDRVNRLQPDVVFLTGDYVSDMLGNKKYAVGAAWQCAEILHEIQCKRTYAILGNHDIAVDAGEVTAALNAKGIPVLRNSYMPLDFAGGRIWLAGLDDVVEGHPDPDRAIPASIRNRSNEPIVVLSHAPDYADVFLTHPAAKSVSAMLSGHTHGGQVRLPFLGAVDLPIWGRKYAEGSFQLGSMQLYVNRGIGTIGVPFRLNCPPEITVHTLRSA